MERNWDDGDRDRVRARLAELVSGLPEVDVVESYGHTGYLVRNKRFGWLLVDHHGDGRLALW